MPFVIPSWALGAAVISSRFRSAARFRGSTAAAAGRRRGLPASDDEIRRNCGRTSRQLQNRVAELEERVDFAERLLAKLSASRTARRGRGPGVKTLTLAVLVAAAACAPAIQSSGLQPVVTERLYFGRNVAQTLGVTDSAWAVFVADVVTARLPEGFTFWTAEGRVAWRDGRAIREPSFVPRGRTSDTVGRH